MEKLSIKNLNNEFLKGVNNISMYQDLNQFQYIGIINLVSAKIEVEKVNIYYNIIVYVNNTLISIFTSVKVIRLFVNDKIFDYELQD